MLQNRPLPTETISARDRSYPLTEAEAGQNEYPIQVKPDAVTVVQTVDYIDDHRAMIQLTGRDSLGVMKHVSDRLAKYDVNMERAYGTRLKDRYTLSLLLHASDAGRLTELLSQLREEKDEQVQGKHVLPVTTYWIRLVAPDQAGLTSRVTRLLYRYDLNLTGLAGTTHPAYRSSDLKYPYPPPAGQLASLKLRIDVPLHRLDEMDVVCEALRSEGKYWHVEMSDSPERDIAPAYPGERGDIYIPGGPLLAGC